MTRQSSVEISFSFTRREVCVFIVAAKVTEADIKSRSVLKCCHLKVVDIVQQTQKPPATGQEAIKADCRYNTTFGITSLQTSAYNYRSPGINWHVRLRTAWPTQDLEQENSEVEKEFFCVVGLSSHKGLKHAQLQVLDNSRVIHPM